MLKPDLTKLVHDAEATGDRAITVAKVLAQRAETPALPDQAWYLQLFSALFTRLLVDYLSLKAACDSEAPEIPLISWRTRNILELWIWTLYCAADPANARRFYNDQAPDTNNMLDAFENFRAKTGVKLAGWDQQMTELRERVNQFASKSGITNDSRFSKVDDVAESLEVGDWFRVLNKVCSKFAHPTSLLLTNAKDIQTSQLSNTMVGLGSILFVQAFNALEVISQSGSI